MPEYTIMPALYDVCIGMSSMLALFRHACIQHALEVRNARIQTPLLFLYEYISLFLRIKNVLKFFFQLFPLFISNQNLGFLSFMP